ncbi:putative deoxyoctulonosic acid synthetase domain protein [Bacteroides fragilis str. 3996 N(B) 6]|uniref:Putative deoxyoctulonosic acid synthetase domain protein n=1 Tax=Bacteroides fragilis str. 3998T(B)3 TaxID=1339316 RepID=A0A015XAA1_BACFG|nr:putative deoxyoctulonosic acid synthetase domain protein [Bacteroides fragilis str. 3996 N(B) 6]EXY89610.1 putative deoxyoctulonosic acid synthetase domain protein [Bacteroides fragilis str. 3998T(B)3]EXY98218.1 putative deoxyoctulonosic acid synthetase domain protein [Bacteroides fragilis str. 3998 T(B) 4]
MGLCITEIADYICHKIEGYSYVVVTDHKKIIDFCNENN